MWFIIVVLVILVIIGLGIWAYITEEKEFQRELMKLPEEERIKVKLQREHNKRMEEIAEAKADSGSSEIGEVLGCVSHLVFWIFLLVIVPLIAISSCTHEMSEFMESINSGVDEQETQRPASESETPQ
jgi:uncharacterized BrkB/YihY/UPF0761 family membrane protein